MYWRDEPITDKQKQMIEYIYDHAYITPPLFRGTTKGEASDFINRYLKDTFVDMQMLERGYD